MGSQGLRRATVLVPPARMLQSTQYYITRLADTSRDNTYQTNVSFWGTRNDLLSIASLHCLRIHIFSVLLEQWYFFVIYHRVGVLFEGPIFEVSAAFRGQRC